MEQIRTKSFPYVYIIILNFNGGKDTLECVDSLRKIDYPNYQIVIVDNNSKKEDIAILHNLENNKDLHFIYNTENLGYASGNNVGIQYAYNSGADYVCVANNDIIVDSHFLTELVESAEKNTNIGIVCPKILDYYQKARVSYGGGEINCFKGGVTICGVNSYDEKVMNTPRSVTFGHGCCMLIRREVLEKIGFLPEKYFLYYEDTDFSYKTLQNGFIIFYNPKAVIYHKESVSTKKWSANYQYYFTRNRLIFIRDNIQSKYKFIPYIYTGMYIIKKLIQRKFSIKNVIQGVKDFYNGKVGMRNNI